MSKRHIFPRAAVAVALMMSVPVAASHADSGSKGDSSGSSTSQSSSAKNAKPASDGSGAVSVTAPVTKADGTKVVTARPVSTAERKADLAASDSPEEMAKERETEAYKTVQEYWTPERIANAKPAPVGSSGASSQKSLKKNVEKAKKALQKEEKLANDKQIAHANGKVLYYDDKKGKDYVCSASAVDSPTKRIVVTAAHCVHGGKGGTWYSNWMFVPAYDKKNRPYGTFPAYHMHAMDEWQREADPDHGKGFESDVAFVTTKNNERGQRLVDTVGGHRLAVSDRTDFDTTIIGYPQNVNGGETMEVCKKTTRRIVNNGFPFLQVWGCGFGGGASGGPWLENYDPKTGLGDVRSITSYKPSDENDVSYIGAPIFDNRTADLFAKANNDR